MLICYVMLCYVTLRYVTLHYVTLRYVMLKNRVILSQFCQRDAKLAELTNLKVITLKLIICFTGSQYGVQIAPAESAHSTIFQRRHGQMCSAPGLPVSFISSLLMYQQRSIQCVAVIQFQNDGTSDGFPEAVSRTAGCVVVPGYDGAC